MSRSAYSHNNTEPRFENARFPPVPGSASSNRSLETRSGRGRLPPDQITSAAFQISAEQDITNTRKGRRKSVILAVGLTLLILLVLALVGVVVYLALKDADHCEVSTSGSPIPTTASEMSTSGGPIPPTANPLITAAPSTIVMPNTGMYSNVELTNLQ